MSRTGIFKIDFDMGDYKHITPSIMDYQQNDFIINREHYEKGDIESCVWKKYKPVPGETDSPQFREREARRILKTGAWICIKRELVWLPPQYYFALQYGKTGGEDLEFRLKRLMHVFFKIEARNNPHCKGTFTVKNRQDGETTMSISDAFWETFDMEDGQIAIQSKTRNDAINPCWKTLQTLWMNLPYWLKSDLCPDFASGTNIAETMKFMRMADERTGVTAKNVLLAYYPAVYNAIDGKNNVKKLIYDEILKWVECNFGDAYNNASKFIMPGFQRRGMFDMFSSPPEKMSQSYKDGYELWLKSDPGRLDASGTTESRIHRWYSNPLHGIQGAYDRYGDADPERIYDWIIGERARQPKDKLLEEVRGFPLNDEEIWGSMEGSQLWSNQKGITERKIFLLGTRYKNPVTKEPAVVYGNLERNSGYIDGEIEFRMSDLDRFDLKEARFCFSYLPQNKEPLKSIFKPPHYVENCLGVDPFNNRYPAKHIGSQSNGAMINRKFRDLFKLGYNKCPTMFYCCRPSHQEIFFEDAIKAAVYNRALVQYENRSDKLANWFEDRGYFDWLLPEIGAAASSLRKGDAPSGGKNAFLEEGMGLINANTNLPLHEGDPYWLEYNWFIDLLTDYLNFNPLDTHANDATMADIQSHIGAIKIMYKKIRQPSSLNNAVLDYWLN